jgi:hypothetical protein
MNMLYDQGWNDAVGLALRTLDQLSDFRPAQRAALQALFVPNDVPRSTPQTSTAERARIYAHCLRSIAKVAVATQNIAGGPQGWQERWNDELASRRTRTEWLAADLLEQLAAGAAEAQP